MSRTYKATGINLKGMALGEADRLITLLTPEYGIIRAVAPSARKQNSKLRGRSELFVVNDLLIAKGKSLDRITQADTIQTYPGLSKDLGKLAASQYLAEIVLGIGLSEQPQRELYQLFNEHLRRLETSKTGTAVLARLCHGVFHIMALSGMGMQVHDCMLTQQPLQPDLTDANFRVGFSLEAGGVVRLLSRTSLAMEDSPPLKINSHLNATELTLLQQLTAGVLPQFELFTEKSPAQINQAWGKVERLLRDSVQYYLGYSIRSASLVDTVWASF